MGALTNDQMPVPATHFGPHAPLRTPGTKSRRPDGLAAYRGLLDGLIRHFPVTPSGGRRRTSTSRNGRATRARSTLHRSTRPSWCSLWLVSQIVTMGKRDATRKIEGCSTRRSSAVRDGKAWAPIGRASAAYLALPRATSRSAMSATYSIDAALPWPLRKLGNASQLENRRAGHDRSVTMNRRARRTTHPRPRAEWRENA